MLLSDSQAQYPNAVFSLCPALKHNTLSQLLFSKSTTVSTVITGPLSLSKESIDKTQYLQQKMTLFLGRSYRVR
jgi:hypothetical protein